MFSIIELPSHKWSKKQFLRGPGLKKNTEKIQSLLGLSGQHLSGIVFLFCLFVFVFSFFVFGGKGQDPVFCFCFFDRVLLSHFILFLLNLNDMLKTLHFQKHCKAGALIPSFSGILKACFSVKLRECISGQLVRSGVPSSIREDCAES